MQKEKFRRYPIAEGSIYDGADMDMKIVSSEEVNTTGINGKILVYILSEDYLNRNSDEITICGYRRTTLFTKKVKLIPEEEREAVKDKLVKILSNEKHIKSIKFW